MKSSEGPESSTAKPKLPSERSAPAAPEPEWPPCPGARPGPAPPAGAPSGPGLREGGGDAQLGARRSPALPRSRSPGAPRLRPDGGSGPRRQEAAGGSRAVAWASARAQIIFKGLKLSSFPCLLRSLLLWNRSPESRGGSGARSPPPDSSAAAPPTSWTRGPGALARRPNSVLAAPALDRTGTRGDLVSEKGA